ncbi:Hypothetical predicted protein [Lynx pardinus]|uniref:Uncharacterized protein n=1 Tax=Lynx pardinus TaxID=191816 RepID=A0A485NR34_LYNPA|nr:Hypothetical predicted protein [Lynx pardinus]
MAQKHCSALCSHCWSSIPPLHRPQHPPTPSAQDSAEQTAYAQQLSNSILIHARLIYLDCREFGAPAHCT